MALYSLARHQYAVWFLQIHCKVMKFSAAKNSHNQRYDQFLSRSPITNENTGGPPPLNQSTVYAAQNRPDVRGLTGAVSADHPLASQVGLRILQEGGNATDAVIAMAGVLAVVRPHIGILSDQVTMGTDGPEGRALGERCLIGMGSTGGPPITNVRYNNLYQIIQTDEYIALHIEMAHDIRIIPITTEYRRTNMTPWFGDSIGQLLQSI